MASPIELAPCRTAALQLPCLTSRARSLDTLLQPGRCTCQRSIWSLESRSLHLPGRKFHWRSMSSPGFGPASVLLRWISPGPHEYLGEQGWGGPRPRAVEMTVETAAARPSLALLAILIPRSARRSGRLCQPARFEFLIPYRARLERAVPCPRDHIPHMPRPTRDSHTDGERRMRLPRRFE